MKLKLKVKEMSVTLHTDLGNIKIELYCDAAPKGCKNFLGK